MKIFSPIGSPRCAVALAAALLLSTGLDAAPLPSAQAVSPGEAERAVAIAGRCPTFSWAPAPGATGHELALYELPESADGEPRLVLRRALPATTSWTPSLADGLRPGQRYAWSVRGLGPAESAWSAPLQFTVALAPSQEEVAAALEVLQRAAAAGAELQAGVPANAARRSEAAPLSPPALGLPTAISAIRGEMPGSSGELVGVTGVSASPDGAGVFGVNQSTSSPAVGVWGMTAAAAGRGVFGEATSASGASAGVLGTSTSTQGTGALGMVSATSGTTYGLFGVSLSPEGYGVGGSAPRGGVYGSATDSATGSGVFGRSSGSGSDAAGVRGQALAASGTAAGVRGETSTDAGAGVLGEAMASCCANQGVFGRTASAGGVGVLGRAISNGGGIGVQGIADSAAGIGVKGNGSGIGVSGESEYHHGVEGISSLGVGVHGTSEYGDGVEGLSVSGSGIRGHSDDDSEYGVRGESSAHVGVFGSGPGGGVVGTSTNGPGVSGTSTNGPGVSGTSTNEDGLYGEASASGKSGVFAVNNNPLGWAAYFTGNVHVNGTLSKLAGAFTIDHPLEPLTRTLSHSFVESPDMKNLYDGTVTLDELGGAWVDLPAWFEALNGELRYQLTPIGAWSPAWIGEPVRDHRFQIRGWPGALVSWQVTGTRQDVWARHHRIEVEADKPLSERGTSLHPAEWEDLLEGETGPPTD